MKNVITILIICLLWGVSGAQTDGAGKKERSLPPVSLSEKVLTLFDEGKWAEAAEELTRLVETTGTDPNLKLYLAAVYARMGQEAFEARKYEDAITHFENGLIYTIDDPALHLGLGFCYFKKSEYGRAEDAFTEVVRLSPENYLAHKMLGEVYYLNGDQEKTVSFWEKALKLSDRDLNLKKRLESLKKQLKVSRDFDTEIDNIFTVIFDGEKDPRLRDRVMSTLVDISREIESRLNLYPRRRITVTLLTKKQFFNITDSPKWSGGLYEGQIKVPVGNYKLDLLKIILCHEYVHAVIHDALPNRCPWWLNEGLAQYFSGDDAGNRQKLELVARLLTNVAEGTGPSLKALPGAISGDTAKAYAAYALALSAVDYMVEFFGVFQVQAIVETMADGRSFDDAVREITNYSFEEFESKWLEARRSR